MQERLKELPKKFLEYWNKWTSKQKTIVVSAVSGVILLIGILIFVLGRTKYVDLYTYPDTKTASQVVCCLCRRSPFVVVMLVSNSPVIPKLESASSLVETAIAWAE